MNISLKSLSDRELLALYAQILEELISREVTRTYNNPVADYAESLVADKLGLVLENNSTAGHDAIDPLSGVKYQIKGRRPTKRNKSTQLGMIRNLEKQEFDYLIAVLFSELFEPTLVLQIPHAIIPEYARYSEHTNAHILVLKSIVGDPSVIDLTKKFRSN